MCTRAKVPGFSSASLFGTSASNGNARVAVLTAGLMRDTLPVNVWSGYASTCSSTGWPTLIHGAIFSGISAITFSGSMRTTLITGICVLTSSPRMTRRFST